MSTRAGVGKSNKPDAFDAGYTACSEALLDADVKTPSLTIVFASTIYDQEAVVRGVREANGNAPLVGCSSAGEITRQGPSRHSVVVMVIQSDTFSCVTSIGSNMKDGAREAGMALIRRAEEKGGKNFAAFMAFPDILSGNGTEVVAGVNAVLGNSVPVVGGAAGDDFAFEKSYQYCDGQVVAGSVAGVGFSGSFVTGVGVRHGWMPIGLPLRVTKSSGQILYELEGVPAAKVYEDYFGEDIERLREEPLARLAITYPLGIKMSNMDEYLVRDPIRINTDGSITCTAEISEGSEVRLMIGSHENVIEAAQVAAHTLMQDFKKAQAHPRILFVFDCIAREKLMGSRAKEEVHVISDIVGRDIPTIGFYSYGEIATEYGARDQQDVAPQFYNETIVLFAIGE